MTNLTRFDGLLTAKASSKHPLQSELTFVFTDFAPNVNKQGVPREEAANIINTALYMPVKMNYLGASRIGDHVGSVPIGPIISMTEENDILIGKAIVWRDEFSEEITYLEKASSSSGAGVHFSWELCYTDSEVDASGVEWLKGCTVAAAAIVHNPAYKGRTPLIAMAESNGVLERLSNMESTIADIKSSIDGLVGLRSEKVSDILETSTVDIEKDVVVVEDTNLDDAESASVIQEVPTEQLESLMSELVELREFKANIERTEAKAALKASRTSILEESGISVASLTDEAIEFILSMDDSQFSAYTVTTASMLKSKASAAASSVGSESIIPDPMVVSSAGSNTLSNLAQLLRRRS